MSRHTAVDVARFYSYVSPSAREHTLFQEAAAFAHRVPEIGFSIPPRLYQVRWYAEDWRVRLDDGWVDIVGGRRPVPVYLKAGRLASARSEEQRRLAERYLMRTIFHELRHVHQELTWPRPLNWDSVEDDAEAFAARALEALAKHEARWQQFVSTACRR